MAAETFRYDGKRVLVVGGATGMGAAAAALAKELGADVVVMDYAEITLPGVTAIDLDLRDKASIDAALDACGGPLHAIFSCAGVDEGTPGIERINFIGHRHLNERAVGEGLLQKGGAVGMISSTAGLGWQKNWDLVTEFLDTPDFETAVKWIDAHPGKANYAWTKQAMCGYVARESFRYLKHGLRLNAIMPGPTDTPLARRNAELWLGFGTDFRAEVGAEPSTPEEQAQPLVFLCSDAASHVNGITLITDLGYASAGVTGSFPPATPVIDFLTGIR